MSLQLFDVAGGFSIDEVIQQIGGTGVPGSGTNDGTAQTALIGAIYQRNAGGNVEFYQKITSGATTADWLRIATIDDVTDAINITEFQDSALDYITDNTLVPPTEVLGDRYILSHDGGAPNAAYDGASAGDIVEFDGTNWVAVTPTTGMIISADDESDLLYYWGGSSWTTKSFEATTASTGLTKVGNDVQLADTTSNTISVTSGTIEVIADGIDDTHIDFGLGANQVNAGDLPYDNTTSGLTATLTGPAIDELDGRIDSLELTTSTQINDLANTGGTEVTVDSVLTDDVAAITWHVHLRDTTTGDVEFVRVSAIHDGSADGVTDATTATYNVEGKLRDANVAGDSFVVDVNGTLAAQELRLRVNATNAFDVRVLRSEAVLWSV